MPSFPPARTARRARSESEMRLRSLYLALCVLGTLLPLWRLVPFFQEHGLDFLMLFVTIDPIGTVALFVSLSSGMTAAQRRRVASRAVIVACAVLLGFLVVGEIFLSHLGVRLVSFQVAGGIILFLFGLQMVF